MTPAEPRERFQELLIQDRGLQPGNGGRVTQRCPGVRDSDIAGDVTGWHAISRNDERRERRVRHARKPDLRREVVTNSRTAIDELASQVGVAEIIRHIWTEDVRIRAEDR